MTMRFMTAEDIGEDMSPVLAGYDHDSSSIRALVADKKGATGSSTKWVTCKIDEAECSGTAATIRSDRKDSIIALKTAVAGQDGTVGVTCQGFQGQWGI